MPKKRPSLRNYLIQGDQVREMDTPKTPPLPETDSLDGESDLKKRLLSLCPPDKLDLRSWALAVFCLLSQGDSGFDMSLFPEAFKKEAPDQVSKILEEMINSGVFRENGGLLTLAPSKDWGENSWEGIFLECLLEKDREMWKDVIQGARREAFNLDEIKNAFLKSDKDSDQFYLLRKKGAPLLPCARESQFRMPLLSVVMWSERGDSRVFFDL